MRDLYHFLLKITSTRRRNAAFHDLRHGQTSLPTWWKEVKRRFLGVSETAPNKAQHLTHRQAQFFTFLPHWDIPVSQRKTKIVGRGIV
ncbi:hypothetical protein ARMSODRAFT_292296 [Armillaria solidipes]|uniref:Uncharacterized protein n=1 Tax=Armillaria solidipes TaxID=1076256 RepID=A0A2H3BEC6_9AGAR|nr:hypothetical protein ARMSODRAFT_292296 [Armillaria solidipes]